MTLSDLAAADAPTGEPCDGVLHHRYVPPVSQGGQAIDEMVISPAGSAPVRTTSFHSGIGKVEFVRTRWEQMPTMAHIVNALADLPVIAYRGASLAETIGMSDLSEQRVVGPAAPRTGTAQA